MPDTKTQTKDVTSQLEFELVETPNGYGFGRNWQLQVTERGPGNKIYRTNLLWLGQDAKVALRIVGCSFDELAVESIKATGSKDWDQNAAYVTRKVVQALRNLGATDESFLTAQPWEMSAE